MNNNPLIPLDMPTLKKMMDEAYETRGKIAITEPYGGHYMVVVQVCVDHMDDYPFPCRVYAYMIDMKNATEELVFVEIWEGELNGSKSYLDYKKREVSNLAKWKEFYLGM